MEVLRAVYYLSGLQDDIQCRYFQREKSVRLLHLLQQFHRLVCIGEVGIMHCLFISCASCVNLHAHVGLYRIHACVPG